MIRWSNRWSNFKLKKDVCHLNMAGNDLLKGGDLLLISLIVEIGAGNLQPHVSLTRHMCDI
jgi:hypothetical protein